MRVSRNQGLGPVLGDLTDASIIITEYLVSSGFANASQSYQVTLATAGYF